MKVRYRYITLLLVLMAGWLSVSARDFNDKLLNRPYADMRAWHLGFSVGVFSQDLVFASNGIATEDGETWFMEQPDYSPGFCVNGLLDLRLNNYFSLRFTPGMYFGNRDIRLIDTTHGGTARENIKQAFVVVPIDVKYAAMRHKNMRPYLTAGVMPTFDVSRRRADMIKLKTTDLFVTVGFGCDFYLPYFKFIPELKFGFGMLDVLDRNRPDLADYPERLKFTDAIKRAVSKMVVLTFYFE